MAQAAWNMKSFYVMLLLGFFYYLWTEKNDEEDESTFSAKNTWKTIKIGKAMNVKVKKIQFYSWHEIKSTEITEQLVELPFHHKKFLSLLFSILRPSTFSSFTLWRDEALIYQKFRIALRIPSTTHTLRHILLILMQIYIIQWH